MLVCIFQMSNKPTNTNNACIIFFSSFTSARSSLIFSCFILLWITQIVIYVHCEIVRNSFGVWMSLFYYLHHLILFALLKSDISTNNGPRTICGLVICAHFSLHNKTHKYTYIKRQTKTIINEKQNICYRKMGQKPSQLSLRYKRMVFGPNNTNENCSCTRKKSKTNKPK